MKILIVRLGALGDIVHAMPAVAALRRGIPSAQIDWLVDARHREVVELVRGINGRISVDPAGKWRELPAVLQRLRRERYDAALDFQGLLKSAVLARFSGAARVIGFSRDVLRERGAAVFYRERREIPRGHHVIEKNLQLAAALGVDVSQISFPFDVPPGPIIEGPYALLNPGAAWPNKRWPPAAFGEIAAWLQEVHGTPSIVLWGPQELDLAREVVDASAGAARLAPPTRIGDVLALARGARLMVSGDTGPLHLAAAVGAPIVGLADRPAPCAMAHGVLKTCRSPGTPSASAITSAAAVGPDGPCIERIRTSDVRAAHRATVRGVTTAALQRLARLRVPLGFVVGLCVMGPRAPDVADDRGGGRGRWPGENRSGSGPPATWRRVERSSGPDRTGVCPASVVRGLVGDGGAGVAIGAGVVGGRGARGTLHGQHDRRGRAHRRGLPPPPLRRRIRRVCGSSRAGEMARRFSLERAWRNKEYRAVVGLVVAIGLLGLKAAFWPPP